MKNFLSDTKNGRLFEKQARRLYEERSNSLLFGCDFHEANLKKCEERAKYIHEHGNSFMRRYYIPLSEWIPPNEKLYIPLEDWEMPCRTHEEIEEFYQDIKSDLEKTESDAESSDNAVSQNWDMDMLDKNACLALLSWEEAYDRLLENLDSDQGNGLYDFKPFAHSTIVLACWFVRGLIPYDPDFATIASMLIEAHDKEIDAWKQLAATYPIAFQDESNRFSHGEGFRVCLEDYFHPNYCMPNYPKDDDEGFWVFLMG